MKQPSRFCNEIGLQPVHGHQFSGKAGRVARVHVPSPPSLKIKEHAVRAPDVYSILKGNNAIVLDRLMATVNCR